MKKKYINLAVRVIVGLFFIRFFVQPVIFVIFSNIILPLFVNDPYNMIEVDASRPLGLIALAGNLLVWAISAFIAFYVSYKNMTMHTKLVLEEGIKYSVSTFLIAYIIEQYVFWRVTINWFSFVVLLIVLISFYLAGKRAEKSKKTI